MVELLQFSAQLAGLVLGLVICYAVLAGLRDRILSAVWTRPTQDSFDRTGVSIMTRIVRA